MYYVLTLQFSRLQDKDESKALYKIFTGKDIYKKYTMTFNKWLYGEKDHRILIWTECLAGIRV